MQISHSLQLIKKRWKIIALFGVLGAILAPLFLWLLPIPLEYRADAEVLIITEVRYGSDPFTAAKSAEQIGQNLASIIKTNDFFNKVFANSQFVIDRSPYENISETKKRKRWHRTVNASVVYGTSVLTLSAYDTDPQEAVRLAGALAQTLIVSSRDYLGSDVTIRVINQPIVSEYPVRPNMLLQAVLGVIIGIGISAILLFN